MAGATDIGFGIVITFQSGFLAEIIDVLDYDDVGKRSVIDTSHMTSTNAWRTFLFGRLKDPGGLTVRLNFRRDKLAAWKTALAAELETVTITFRTTTGDATGGVISFSGGISGSKGGFPLDDKMTVECSLKASGEPTFTSAT